MFAEGKRREVSNENLHSYTVEQRYQTLYCPTNAYNVINVGFLKHIRIMKASPTCFGLQGNHHQGATTST